MLEMVADHVVYDTALHDPTEVPKAPGMKYRHYAPDMPVQVLVGASQSVVAAIQFSITGEHLLSRGSISSCGDTILETTNDRYLLDSNSSEDSVEDRNNLHARKRTGLFVSQQTWDRLIKALGVQSITVNEDTHMSHLASLGVGSDMQDIVAIIYGETAEPVSLANQLYEGLLAFNEKDVDLLVVEGCEKEGLGVAVMNRLEKASGGNVSYLE